MNGDFPIGVAVIIAGGGGTRLWPWTGPGRPKPLLPLGGGGRTLLSSTLDRLRDPGPPVIRLQAPEQLGRQLVASDPRLSARSLDSEPSPRDTAPAVALAMRRVFERSPATVVAILPADQRVGDERAFRAALEAAGRVARDGAPVVLAVEPDEPSTRFGWIECEPAPVAGARASRSVRRFVEKPELETARSYQSSGRHFINAGIFVWRADVFWSALERHAPDVAGPVATFAASGLGTDWDGATKTSIDYALLEKLPGLEAVPLDAAWDDIGSWDAVARLVEAGDAGPARAVDCDGDAAAGSLVISTSGEPPPRAVLLGEQPLLVVHGPGGLLVSPRREADRVKSFGR